MKYFVLDASVTAKHPEGDALQAIIKAHLAYLQAGVDAGTILLSGPKIGAGGGIIIVKANDLEEVERFCAKDPVILEGIHEYRITEFRAHNTLENVKDWFS